MSRARDLADGTFSGDLTIPDKVVHTDDTNTAIRFPAADTVTVETAGSERVRVDSSGNVGIGTSSPNAKLTSATASNTTAISIVDTSATLTGNETNYLSFFGTDNTGTVFSTSLAQIGAVSQNGSFAQGVMVFHTTPFSGSSTERMRIDSSGNVGIGTSSPAAKLDVWPASTDAAFRGNAGVSLQVPAFEFRGYNINATNAGLDIRTYYDGAFADRVRIEPSGNVGIGTTASEGPSRLSTVQTATNQSVIACRHTLGAGEPFIRFINSSNSAVIGSIANSGNTGTAYNTSSDYRLKENVVPLAGAADRLAQIPVHRFNFIADPDRTVDGFLAHEVQEFVPECVTGTKDQVETVEVTDEDGNVTTETRPVYQGIDQSKLVPLLTAALQEALADIATLKAEVAALKGSA